MSGLSKTAETPEEDRTTMPMLLGNVLEPEVLASVRAADRRERAALAGPAQARRPQLS
jgi:hypothetical protein